MTQDLRQLVRLRAGSCCEYCHLPEALSVLPFQLDHIVARKHEGSMDESNLAWACFYCNSYKGPNLSGWNVAAKEVVRLFNPRSDQWRDHFQWNGPVLGSRTAIGAVTIAVLKINHPDAVAVRKWLLEVGEQLT